MSSTAIATVAKMMESLAEPLQERIAEHLRDYIEDLRDESRWDSMFRETQLELVSAARRAKTEIAEGKAEPLNFDRL